jgi:hypothetical protein
VDLKSVHESVTAALVVASVEHGPAGIVDMPGIRSMAAAR